MSTQIAVRLPDEAVAFLDEQVASGAAKSRAELISRVIKRERRRLAAERDLEKLGANPYREFDAMHEWVKARGYPELD